jgi:hypothetical protein
MHHQGDGCPAIARQRLGDASHRLQATRRSADRQDRKVGYIMHDE